MICNFCKTDSKDKLLKCGCCGKVSYCNKECQAKDWKNHKDSCPPYIIRDVPGKGRGMFATRKIVPGKIILEENPLLTLNDGPGVLGTFRKDHYPNIDQETKNKILQLHDPAENIKVLEDKNVDLFDFYMKNPTLLVWKKTSLSDEASKILRIYTGNSVAICNLPSYKGDKSGLYHDISRINHSCNPNVVWSYVKQDLKKKQVRALKTIEKGEEILVNYRDFLKFNIGSREYRQETMMEFMAFQCQCSECSLEGESLMENERIRAEIREKELKIRGITQFLSPFSPNHNSFATSVKLSQDIVKLVKHLDLRLDFVTYLLNTFEGAYQARLCGVRGVPNPDIYRKEALEYCKMFGDEGMFNHYNTVMEENGLNVVVNR